MAELMQIELRKEISMREKRLQQKNAEKGVFGKTLEDVIKAEMLCGIAPFKAKGISALLTCFQHGRIHSAHRRQEGPRYQQCLSR